MDPSCADHASGNPASGDPVPKLTGPLDMNDSPSKKIPAKLREKGLCKVCSDTATGMYFGALVCVPCKVCKLYSDIHPHHAQCLLQT